MKLENNDGCYLLCKATSQDVMLRVSATSTTKLSSISVQMTGLETVGSTPKVNQLKLLIQRLFPGSFIKIHLLVHETF